MKASNTPWIVITVCMLGSTTFLVYQGVDTKRLGVRESADSAEEEEKEEGGEEANLQQICRGTSAIQYPAEVELRSILMARSTTVRRTLLDAPFSPSSIPSNQSLKERREWIKCVFLDPLVQSSANYLEIGGYKNLAYRVKRMLESRPTATLVLLLEHIQSETDVCAVSVFLEELTPALGSRIGVEAFRSQLEAFFRAYRASEVSCLRQRGLHYEMARLLEESDFHLILTIARTLFPDVWIGDLVYDPSLSLKVPCAMASIVREEDQRSALPKLESIRRTITGSVFSPGEEKRVAFGQLLEDIDATLERLGKTKGQSPWTAEAWSDKPLLDVLLASRDAVQSGDLDFITSRVLMRDLLRRPDSHTGDTIISNHKLNAMVHARALMQSQTAIDRSAQTRGTYAEIVESYRVSGDFDEKVLWLAELKGLACRLGPCEVTGKELFSIAEEEFRSPLTYMAPRYWSKWVRLVYISLQLLAPDLRLVFGRGVLQNDPPPEFTEGLCEVFYRSEVFNVRNLDVDSVLEDRKLSQYREVLLCEVCRLPGVTISIAQPVASICLVTPPPAHLEKVKDWLYKLAASSPLAAEIYRQLDEP